MPLERAAVKQFDFGDVVDGRVGIQLAHPLQEDRRVGDHLQGALQQCFVVQGAVRGLQRAQIEFENRQEALIVGGHTAMLVNDENAVRRGFVNGPDQ